MAREPSAPDLSVVVPCHDAEATIRRCVESALASPLVLEVVVVDDASRDGGPALVEALAASHPGRVRLLRLPENRGPATARNRGAREAKGRLLFFIDSDTELQPDALARFVARVTEAEVVSGLYHPEPLNAGAAPRYKALLTHYLLSRHGVAPFPIFNGACAGLRRETFLAVGGYDESLRWGDDYENEELGQRLSTGRRMIIDPAIMVRHHFPGAGKLAHNLFCRTRLWARQFLARRSFDKTGATTAETGAASAAVLAAVALVPVVVIWPAAWPALALALGAHFWGYRGFYGFVLRRSPRAFPAVFALNLAYVLVVACGAAAGLLDALARRRRPEQAPAQTRA